jgi:predicted DNA-binding transcriptional regulator YafY
VYKAAMDRTERFYKIELLLRSRGCVSFADLIEALSVSPATLKRDLAYLRDRMDAPIVYDSLANGYRFGAEAGNTKAGPRHELPGLWFSRAGRRRRAGAPPATDGRQAARHARQRCGRSA